MSREFEKVAVSRGLPFAKIGMRVKFRDEYGFIYRHNGSANFDIFFDNGIIGNCHPAWKMTYFDEDGKVIENHGNEDTTYMFGVLPSRYEVWVEDSPDERTIIWAKTLGRAKSRFIRDLDAVDWLEYVNIRGRKLK